MARPPLRLGLLPVGLFLIFGIAAALIVPSDYSVPRPTPPDEGAHLGYVAYLAEHLRLPVFFSQSDNYEAHQPPLFYATALPAYLIGQSGATGHLVAIVRLWSVLVAAAGVWVAWLIGRRVFGGLMALAPALFLALWPARTLVLSAITNDGMAELLSLLTFYFCIVILQQGLTTRRAAWLGLAFGLALMAKSSTMALGPVALLAVVMAGSQTTWYERHPAARARRDEQDAPADSESAATRKTLLALLAMAAVVLAVAGWWFVRNQILYGDPMAAEAFNRLFKVDRATPEYFLRLGLSGGAYFMLVVMNTALSFWGVYGQANVWSPAWYYWLGFGLWALALAGLVRQKASAQELTTVRGASSPEGLRERRSRQDAARTLEEKEASGEAGQSLRQIWILAWVLLVTVIVLFLRFNTEFYQAQARYLFVANAPIALLMIGGWWGLERRRWGLWVVGAGLAVLLVMSVWSVFGYAGLVAAHYPPPFFGSVPGN